MSYYFVAQIWIHDETAYQKYLDGAGEVFKKYNGKYLAVDSEPVLLEGDWDYSRTVLIEFNSQDDFDAWYHSEDYQGILRLRLAAAKCDSILVKGLPH